MTIQTRTLIVLSWAIATGVVLGFGIYGAVNWEEIGEGSRSLTALSLFVSVSSALAGAIGFGTMLWADNQTFTLKRKIPKALVYPTK